MELRPLYKAYFTYPLAFDVPIRGDLGSMSQHFYMARGVVEGRVSGRFQGANHPRRRTDGTYCPDFQGVLETEDGATVYFDWQGYGRAYPPGRRQIVAAAFHLSGDERYKWLNDVVSVAIGEVRIIAGPHKTAEPTGKLDAYHGVELVLEVAELVWRPFQD